MGKKKIKGQRTQSAISNADSERRFAPLYSVWTRICIALLLFGSNLTLIQAQPEIPVLSISSSNDTVTLSWPLSGYYYFVESTTNVLDRVQWGTSIVPRWYRVASGAPMLAESSRYWPLTPSASNAVPTATTNILADRIEVGLQPTNASAPRFFRLRLPYYLSVAHFAIFYDGLLEFSGASALDITGPVHANGPIYVGSDAALTFSHPVTTTSTITDPANDGHSNTWSGTVAFNGYPATITNTPSLPLVISAYGINARTLIEPPPEGESPASFPGSERRYNTSSVLILVSNATTIASNTTVTLRLQDYSVSNGVLLLPALDTNAFVTNVGIDMITTTFPFLSVTNRFFDQREHKTNLTTQIDVGLYRQWMGTNYDVRRKFDPYSGPPFQIYVADLRNVSDGELAVVRLTNGARVPENLLLGNWIYGFSLATPNPLYIWGNYNCTNAALLGTSDTSATVPALLVSDALTLLSSQWKDATSFTNSSTGPTAASSMTVNAVIVTGDVPSTGSGTNEFSGGVHNLPRLLENWSSRSLWINGTLARFYASAQATNRFVHPGNSGSYYLAPMRHLNYDTNFFDVFKQPGYAPYVGKAP